MSSQYERAVLERFRHSHNNGPWLTIAIIGLLVILVVIISLSLFSESSTVSERHAEFHKTLFEQTNGLLGVNYFLVSRQDKNKHYFSKLNKYSNEINHRFEIISEFIDNNDLPIDQKRFKATENAYRKNLDAILAKGTQLIQYHNAIQKMIQTLPKLLAKNTEINNLLFKNNASSNHIYYFTRQLFLIERMSSNIKILGSDLGDSSFIVTAADRMSRDMALLIRVYQGLLKGDYKMNVSKINNLKIRNELNKVNKLTKILSTQVSTVIELGPEAFQFIDLRMALNKGSLKLQKSYQTLFFEK